MTGPTQALGAPLGLVGNIASAVAVALPGAEVTQLQVLAGGRSATTAKAELRLPTGRHATVAVRAEIHDRKGLSLRTPAQQMELLEIVRRHGVPAPLPLAAAADPGGTGLDVLVTEFIEGDVPNPWTSAGRRTLAELRLDNRFRNQFVDTLAAIHAIAPSALPEYLRPGHDEVALTHVRRSRERSAAVVDRSGLFRDDPVLAYVASWLRTWDRLPDQHGGLVHGDYRIGNIVVCDSSLVAVLDWELAEAGETYSDVAWLCGPQGSIDGLAAGLFLPDDLLDRYAQVSGRIRSPRSLEYLVAEGTLRTTAVWAQLDQEEVEAGNEVAALRCRDSTLRLIGMCADALHLDRPSPTLGPSRTVKSTTQAIAAVLDDVCRLISIRGGSDAPSTPVQRPAAIFLERVTAALSDPSIDGYLADCVAFVDDYWQEHSLVGCDLTGPAEGLAVVVRNAFAERGRALHTDTDQDAVRIRSLVAMSARPTISFANMSRAWANAPGEES